MAKDREHSPRERLQVAHDVRAERNRLSTSLSATWARSQARHVGEEKWNVAADQYGKIFSISERDMVNDDLGAFDRIAECWDVVPLSR